MQSSSTNKSIKVLNSVAPEIWDFIIFFLVTKLVSVRMLLTVNIVSFDKKGAFTSHLEFKMTSFLHYLFRMYSYVV